MSKTPRKVPKEFEAYAAEEEVYTGAVLAFLLEKYLDSGFDIPFLDWLDINYNAYVSINSIQRNNGRKDKTVRFLEHIGVFTGSYAYLTEFYSKHKSYQVSFKWIMDIKLEADKIEYGPWKIEAANHLDESIFDQSYFPIKATPFRNLAHIIHNQDKYSIRAVKQHMHESSRVKSLPSSTTIKGVLPISNFEKTAEVYKASVNHYVRNNKEEALDRILGRNVFQEDSKHSFISLSIPSHFNRDCFLEDARAEAERFQKRYEAQLEIAKIIGTDKVDAEVISDYLYQKIIDETPMYMADENQLGFVARHILKQGLPS